VRGVGTPSAGKGEKEEDRKSSNTAAKDEPIEA
jgi:hypothetical protein